MILTSKLFGLFLRAGKKQDMEKKIRSFRSKHKKWDVFNLYRCLYIPVSLVTRTRTIVVKLGQVQRRRGLTPRLDRPTKALIRIRKWITHAVRGRSHRTWWPRVISELTTLRGASRFYVRYLKTIARGAAVI